MAQPETMLRRTDPPTPNVFVFAPLAGGPIPIPSAAPQCGESHGLASILRELDPQRDAERDGDDAWSAFDGDDWCGR